MQGQAVLTEALRQHVQHPPGILGHVAPSGGERLRTRLVQRLVRRKALDAARLLGRPVLLIDATGLLCFSRRHGPHCLVQRHATKTLDLHPVREAQLLGPAGVVVSLGSAFIENADAGDVQGKSAADGGGGGPERGSLSLSWVPAPGKQHQHPVSYLALTLWRLGRGETILFL
jgi:hypothetical protein